MSELYDADVYEWSQHQAALLRRRAAGELVNEAELDWPNIAEEIESVGSEQLHAVSAKPLRSQEKCREITSGASGIDKEWRLEVTDGTDLVLFTLHFLLVVSPAAAPSRRSVFSAARPA